MRYGFLQFVVEDKIRTEDPSLMPVRLPLKFKSEVKTERDAMPRSKTATGTEASTQSTVKRSTVRNIDLYSCIYSRALHVLQ